jgi:hypothetical protein
MMTTDPLHGDGFTDSVEYEEEGDAAPQLAALLDPPFDLWSAHDEDLVDAPPADDVPEPVQLARVLPFRRPAAIAPPAAAEPVAPAPPVKRSLRSRVNAVDFIAATIEALDPEEVTDEVRAELSAQLIEELAGTREKVDATGRVFAMYETLIAGAKSEKERLAKREARFERLRQRLEDYVLALLTASKLDAIEGETSTLTKRNNPPRLDVTAPELVPAKYLRTPPAPGPVPDKDAIKKAIKGGAEVPGCQMVQGARLVRS